MNPDAPLAELLDRLAARAPVPGGGAAACLAAAVGCAVAAMAVRYTTGKKWADRAVEAASLAERLDTDRAAFLSLAEEDARAYEALAAALKDPGTGPEERRRLEREAAEVPLRFLRRCAAAAAALAAFRDRCNARLACDLDAGSELLAGAARAALGIMLSNDPEAADRREAEDLVAGLGGSPA